MDRWNPPITWIVVIDGDGHDEHISADIAWAAIEYVAWTGDEEFLTGRGRQLLSETARFWSSSGHRM